ncbi:MAG TPA: hypothetical protein PLK82_11575 [Bacteroidales bacterium]|nr:hypothetical protein [Bacteroidales bacterium]
MTCDHSGGLVTTNRIRAGSTRVGFDPLYFPGLRIGRFEWLRAHTAGDVPVTAGTGGLVYAPAEVTRYYDQLGIEKVIAGCFRRRTGETELWLTTTLCTHRHTQRVKKLAYRFDAVKSRSSTGLYEAWLTIGDTADHPLVIAETRELVSRQNWESALR